MWVRTMTTFLTVAVLCVIPFMFWWALEISIKNSAEIPHLQRGDSVVVVTPQGTYNLFIYCEGDGYLKCTDEEGQLHIFRGVYEIHQKQLPEKLAPLNHVDSPPPHTSKTLLR